MVKTNKQSFSKKTNKFSDFFREIVEEAKAEGKEAEQELVAFTEAFRKSRIKMNKKLFLVPDEKGDPAPVVCHSHGECRCGDPGISAHTCPFSEEINGDCETECNCCDDCTHQCVMDI